MRQNLFRNIFYQIITWVAGYNIYGFSVYFITTLDPVLNTVTRPYINIQWATAGGIAVGFFIGLLDYLIQPLAKRIRSLLLSLILKSLLYLVLIVSTIFMGTMIWLLIDKDIPGNVDINSFIHIYMSILVFSLFYSLLISFISMVRKKYGPGNMLPIILGKYRYPQTGERIFMFLDLKSSTKYAEQLGHIKYSRMIQDCFIDLNHLVSFYRGEIYQYVGDEAVLVWKINKGLENLNCIKLYFDFIERLHNKSDYYKNIYGLIPDFKAGMNCGKVTIVEVGDLKRDIAYHGDAINTASRIQNLCNEYGESLLISDEMNSRIPWQDNFHPEYLGEVMLKGKAGPVKILSIRKKTSEG